MNSVSQPGQSASVVLITGAGSGLGAAMARRFAAAGYRVAVSDVDAERAALISDELTKSGNENMHLRLDVTRDEDWNRVYDELSEKWGEVNVLINNAGVAASGLCEETSLEDWQWVMDIDLMGVVRGCHKFLPMLRKQAQAGKRAHVINIASFAGFSAFPGLSAYGTAKAAVVALSEHLLTELDGSGVGVSVVCPSFVSTNLLESFRGGEPEIRNTVQKWMKHSPVTAEDIAEIVYQAMMDNEFLVLTHPKTRTALLMKRFMPKRYYKRISKMAQLARGSGS